MGKKQKRARKDAAERVVAAVRVSVTEACDEGDTFAYGCGESPASLRSPSALAHAWHTYVAQQEQSIKTRVEARTADDQPRVREVLRACGTKRFIDLLDVSGRERARVLYDGVGKASEVRWWHTSGQVQA